MMKIENIGTYLKSILFFQETMENLEVNLPLPCQKENIAEIL